MRDKNHSASAVPDVERRYLNKKEAAAMLGVTTRCLSNWMRDRTIPFYRLGEKVVRFDPLQVREHLNAHFKFEKREVCRG
jgi:excisionase family DNA binding protein